MVGTTRLQLPAGHAGPVKSGSETARRRGGSRQTPGSASSVHIFATDLHIFEKYIILSHLKSSPPYPAAGASNRPPAIMKPEWKTPETLGTKSPVPPLRRNPPIAEQSQPQPPATPPHPRTRHCQTKLFPFPDTPPTAPYRDCRADPFPKTNTRTTTGRTRQPVLYLELSYRLSEVL